jgi:hypothetical protein
MVAMAAVVLVVARLGDYGSSKGMEWGRKGAKASFYNP